MRALPLLALPLALFAQSAPSRLAPRDLLPGLERGEAVHYLRWDAGEVELDALVTREGDAMRLRLFATDEKRTPLTSDGGALLAAIAPLCERGCPLIVTWRTGGAYRITAWSWRDGELHLDLDQAAAGPPEIVSRGILEPPDVILRLVPAASAPTGFQAARYRWDGGKLGLYKTSGWGERLRNPDEVPGVKKRPVVRKR